MQTSLFEDVEQKAVVAHPPGKAEILPALSGSSDEKTAKLHRIFNSRIKKINALNKKMEDLDENLRQLHFRFQKEVQPTQNELGKLMQQLVKKLDAHYDTMGFTAIEKDALEAIVVDLCQRLLEDFKMPLRDIQLKYFQKTVSPEEQEMMKEMLAEMMGIELDEEVDIDDFIKLSQEDLYEKYREKFDAANENRENVENEDFKKSKKQLEKEAKKEDDEKLLSTDIKYLYKHLSKMIHPDLEKDAEMRAKKEEMMKRLTEARKTNDLYTLFHIKAEADNLHNREFAGFEAAQIERFNAMLYDQIIMLEREEFYIKKQLQETSFYYEKFYARNPKAIDNKFKKYLENLKEERIALQHQLEMVKTKKGTKILLHKLTYNDNWALHDFE